ncbi:MAG: hypothetical protein L6R41_007518 [Letrouitia leprolyta]|nr:MAG: hypothetical protein L6R41_007518 [Letrouitia leprolyta]
MAKELVLCYCNKCNRHNCTTSNAWTEWNVEKPICTYDDSILFANPGLIVSGQRKPAQGDLKGCIIQSLVCAGCEALIGITCVEASTDKGSCRDRSFLSLNTLTMKSMANGQIVPPSVTRRSQRISELANAHTGKTEQRPTVPAVLKNTQNHGVQASINTNSHHGPNSVPDQGSSTLLEGQRKDIDRVIANVETLMQDMKTLKASMEYLKFQQKTFETFTDNELAKSPTTLTSDLQVLTDRMSQVTSKVDRVHSLTEGLNALTERVSKVDTGVSEVGELKQEIKHLKRRIKRLENTNINSQASKQASRSEPSFILDSQRRFEPIQNGQVISQEIPSSTRSHSEHTTAYLRRSASTISPKENGLQYVSDSAPDRPLNHSRDSTDGHMTPGSNLVDLLQPQITSAGEVLTLKRRRSPSSSSSTSSSSSSSTSSDAIPPPHKRPPNRLGIHNKSDGNTTPRFDTFAKRKATSLNDREHILTSDPEDSDYDPSSLPQDLPNQLNNKDLPRIRSKPPLRLPTPEWEKPDWEHPYLSGRGGGHSSARRGVSGRGAFPPRRGRPRRRNSGHHHHTNKYNGYVIAQSPDYWADDTPSSSSMYRHSGTPDNLFAKPRDSQGRLLRSDGKVDGRSLRQQKEKDARMRAEAQERRQALMRLQENMTETSTVAQNPIGQFVDAAALKAAGLGMANANGTADVNRGVAIVEEMVAGIMDGVLRGSIASLDTNGQVDGPADGNIAGDGNAAETSQISSTGIVVKHESGGTVAPSTAIVASTESGGVASPPGQEGDGGGGGGGGGGETHAKLMKQVFRWR